MGFAQAARDLDLHVNVPREWVREHAAELEPVNGMERHQDVSQPDAGADRFLEDLDVLVAIEAREMGDGVADVLHRQRLAHSGFEQARDQLVGDDPSFFLDADLRNDVGSLSHCAAGANACITVKYLLFTLFIFLI